MTGLLPTTLLSFNSRQSGSGCVFMSPRPSSRRLGKDFLRLLLKHIHRADVWDWTVANARDAQLGETLIRGHAVHNHNIHW
jgi:hypothetical protein